MTRSGSPGVPRIRRTHCYVRLARTSNGRPAASAHATIDPPSQGTRRPGCGMGAHRRARRRNGAAAGEPSHVNLRVPATRTARGKASPRSDRSARVPGKTSTRPPRTKRRRRALSRSRSCGPSRSARSYCRCPIPGWQHWGASTHGYRRSGCRRQPLRRRPRNS